MSTYKSIDIKFIIVAAISIISIMKVNKIKYVQSYKASEFEGAFLVGKVFLGPKGTEKR